MNKIILGKYVNTHGLKGEIRIKSDFPYKDQVFKIGKEIILDKPYTITSYRVHKDYDMVTLEGINRIEDIPFSKNSLVYIDKDLIKDISLDEDLIGYKVVNSYLDLMVTDVKYLNNGKKILDASNKLIPFELIDKIDHDKKIIMIKEVMGL